MQFITILGIIVAFTCLAGPFIGCYWWLEKKLRIKQTRQVKRKLKGKRK